MQMMVLYPLDVQQQDAIIIHIGASSMDREFLYTIVGCVLFAPLVFLVVRLNTSLRKKRQYENDERSRYNTNHPARINDPSSLAWHDDFHRHDQENRARRGN